MVTELKKLNKAELISRIENLIKEIEKLQKDIEHLKAKHAGLIGVGATRNPLVK